MHFAKFLPFCVAINVVQSIIWAIEKYVQSSDLITLNVFGVCFLLMKSVENYSFGLQLLNEFEGHVTRGV